jgi:hypothetical protein
MYADPANIGRTAKGAALGYLARAYMNRPIFEQGQPSDWANAEAALKQIIENEMVPNLKAGNFYRAVDEATSALIRGAAGEYKAPAGYNKKGNKKGIPAGLIFFIIILVIVIMSEGGGGGGVMSRRDSVVEYWPAYYFLPGGSGGGGGGGWSGAGGGGGLADSAVAGGGVQQLVYSLRLALIRYARSGENKQHVRAFQYIASPSSRWDKAPIR